MPRPRLDRVVQRPEAAGRLARRRAEEDHTAGASVPPAAGPSVPQLYLPSRQADDDVQVDPTIQVTAWAPRRDGPSIPPKLRDGHERRDAEMVRQPTVLGLLVSHGSSAAGAGRQAMGVVERQLVELAEAEGQGKADEAIVLFF